jgi:putative membrane protein
MNCRNIAPPFLTRFNSIFLWINLSLLMALRHTRSTFSTAAIPQGETLFMDTSDQKEITLHRSDRSIKDYLLILLKGLCMGAADVVPGVSGGTIAFLTGVYEEWLQSLKRCTPAVLLMLKRDGIVKTWKYINGNFLLALFGGILISLKTFASVVLLGMEHYPILVWAFFSGLLATSVIHLLRGQRGWGKGEALGVIVGIAFVLTISLMAPAQLPGYGWMLFLGGFVAICAMILPGISGSFILLLVGLYPVFLQAIHELDIVKLIWFGTGCICGLVVFSRFMLWLLNTYHTQTMSVSVGLLVGSLYVTWPWKEVLSTTINNEGKEIVLQQVSISPGYYAQLTNNDPMILAALACALAGVSLVLGLEFAAGWMKNKNRPA